MLHASAPPVGRSRRSIVPRPSAWLALVSAPLAVAFVYLVQETLFPSSHALAAFVLFFMAVIVITWMGGRSAGLFAVALSAAVANYAFLDPRDAWSTSDPALKATILFVIASATAVLLCAALRDAIFLAERTAGLLRRQVAMLDLSRDAIFLWRPDTGVEEWSRGAETLYGFTAAEARGRLPRELLHTRFPVPLEEVEERLRVHGRWNGELVHTTRDGRDVVVFSSLQRVRLEAGDEVVLESNRDLRERKTTEEALRRYQLVVRQSRDAILITDRASGRILEASPAAAVVYGCDREELLDLPLGELEGGEAPGAALPDEGEALFESVHQRRDGSTFPVEVSSRAAMAGATPIVVSVVRDISERKSREDRLRASEATLEAFFRASPGILVILDEDLRCLKVDDVTPTYFGGTREELLGRRLEDLSPRFHERFAPVFREVIETGVPRLNEPIELAVAARPEPASWRVSFFPVPLTGGRRGIGAIGLEITDLRKAERELRMLDEKKNDFLAVLSHELRNPLAPIRNSVYILERAEPGSPHAERALRIVHRQVDQLTRIVDDLLDLNRISRGKIQLQREPVVLNDLVLPVAEDLKTLFEVAGVRLEIAATAEPLPMDGDPTRVCQMVHNLLQNAAKFTPRGGWTHLSLGRSGSEAVIEVSDNGSGIEPELIGRLFDSFVQAERTLDRARGGLGLGLSLVKALAELHGGTVSARSEGLGHGATFTVRLPLSPAQPAAGVPGPAPSRPGRSRHVLVIEDSPDTAASLAEALTMIGHVVTVARTGEEGLELARASVPDAVLCDVGLPDLDGDQVARALRADPRFQEVLLIALSGYALPEDVERSEAAGFDRHLAKPVDPAVLERLLADRAREPVHP